MFQLGNSIRSSDTKPLKFVSAIAVLVGISMVATSVPANAESPVLLGTTSNFAVLAGSGISDIGPTTVSGTAGADLGSSPTGTFVNDVQVTTTGTKYTAVDPIVTTAKTDLVTAYNDAAARTSTETISADLGGRTLVSGVYSSESSMGLTNNLTLDGANDPNSVWIFQVGSTLTTANSSTITLINDAQPCNVFWQVGSSATFGTASTFVGHVFALTSITATTGATFNGQLLARNGAVTLDTNTITNNVCAAAPTASPSASPTTSSSPSPSPVVTTVSGGPLPHTETSWQTKFYAGLGLFVIGLTVGVVRRRRI